MQKSLQNEKERYKIEQEDLQQLQGYTETVIIDLQNLENCTDNTKKYDKILRRTNISMDALNTLVNIMSVTEQGEKMYGKIQKTLTEMDEKMQNYVQNSSSQTTQELGKTCMKILQMDDEALETTYAEQTNTDRPPNADFFQKLACGLHEIPDID